MCASTRYLLVGGLAGMGASTITGSDFIGLLVGVGAALLLFAATRRFPGRFGASSCSITDRAGQAGAEPMNADGAIPPAEVTTGR